MLITWYIILTIGRHLLQLNDSGWLGKVLLEIVISKTKEYKNHLASVFFFTLFMINEMEPEIMAVIYSLPDFYCKKRPAFEIKYIEIV